MEESYDIVIVGAGAAGIAAAWGACETGKGRILLIDRKKKPGGVLLQCSHRGFGRNQTGPEFVQKLLEGFPEEICFFPETTVLSVFSDRTMIISSFYAGFQKIRFNQLILASGCLEIPVGALPVAGTRPPGIYTAGYVQEMLNLYHQVPEEPVVILGSGDLGAILAGQLSARGVKIAAVVEQKSGCCALARNQHYFTEYEIPLLYRATVTEVFGGKEVTGVKIQNLDTGEETKIPCKSLLTAVGLRPDRSLIDGLEEMEWVHICGNCNYVHAMVEAVVKEGRQAGMDAAEQIKKIPGINPPES